MEAIRLLEKPLSPGDTITINNALKEARQEGRREVVECMQNEFKFCPEKGSKHDEMWQAKLKKWGI